jgi:hypothetical protein
MSLLVMAILPCALFLLIKIFLPKVLPFISFPGNTSAYFLFFYSLWLLFLWISFSIQWTKFHLDVWYVTEKRIFRIERMGIGMKDEGKAFQQMAISAAGCEVTVDIHGLIPTLLNFGTVEVETASKEDNGDFIMRAVRDPDNVRRVIFDRHNRN